MRRNWPDLTFFLKKIDQALAKKLGLSDSFFEKMMSGGFGGGGGGGGQVQQQQVQQAPQEEEKPVCKNVKTDMD